MNAKLTVIGIGNTLRKDDGIGVKLIEILEKEQFPAEVKFVSGNISGIDIIKHFESNSVVIIDAANLKIEPGTIKCFGPADLKPEYFKKTFSTHEIGLKETIELALKLNITKNIRIVGIEPYDTGFGLELTASMNKKLSCLARKIKEIILELFPNE